MSRFCVTAEANLSNYISLPHGASCRGRWQTKVGGEEFPAQDAYWDGSKRARAESVHLTDQVNLSVRMHFKFTFLQAVHERNYRLSTVLAGRGIPVLSLSTPPPFIHEPKRRASYCHTKKKKHYYS